MDDLYIKRNIICIDLKSFFASVECVDRNLDPFTTPLIVCDPKRDGAITLAVAPYLKQFGIKGRSRVFELPKNIPYIKVPPRMKLYQEKSKEVIQIYLEYIAPEDLHIYSIDECFLDVTNYLKLYKKTDYELAKEIIAKVYEKTKLTVTAGIGPNMLLAKVSMDIEAKHIKDNIAYWTYDDVQTKLWKLKPLSKMWGIGANLEKRLNEFGIKSIGDLANFNKEKLIKEFGIIGGELWYHANGIDLSKISDFNNHEVKEKSFSHSQVLFKDYYDYNITIIIFEMLDVLCRRLRKENMTCQSIYLGISYSKNIGGGFGHNIKLDKETNDINYLFKIATYIFEKYYTFLPIRKVSLSLSKLKVNNEYQLNIFEKYEEIEKNKRINKTVDEIKEKYGKNSVIPASSLLSDSTLKERNEKIGGHHE